MYFLPRRISLAALRKRAGRRRSLSRREHRFNGVLLFILKHKSHADTSLSSKKVCLRVLF
jgi:hypothetical protein